MILQRPIRLHVLDYFHSDTQGATRRAAGWMLMNTSVLLMLPDEDFAGADATG
jgi:hypothetical protein